VPILWLAHDVFHVEPFGTEKELESAILEVSGALFGASRIYLDAKRKIGTAGKTVNIPDGYLIDLSSAKKPVLYLVENELAKHDPLRHIAVQLLQFSLSFDATRQTVKNVVRKALESNMAAWKKCETYAHENGFENLDYLLEQMIYRGGFQALVIIDELQDDLEAVLVSKFRFPVEVLTLSRYLNTNGVRMYEFEPFLADVATLLPTEVTPAGINGTSGKVDPSEIDTIVVPAREDGFQETAVGENRWYAVRIHGSIIPKIKYIAFYRVAPRSAITHIAPVQSIEPWESSGKYVLNFAEPLNAISPLKLIPGGKVKAPQSVRYTSHDRLINATSLDETF